MIRRSTFLTPVQHSTSSFSCSEKTSKGKKEMQISKEERIAEFADNMILCVKDSKDATRILLQLITIFINVAGYKSACISWRDASEV